MKVYISVATHYVIHKICKGIENDDNFLMFFNLLRAKRSRVFTLTFITAGPFLNIYYLKTVTEESLNDTYEVTRLGITRMQSSRRLTLTGMTNAPMSNAYSQIYNTNHSNFAR